MQQPKAKAPVTYFAVPTAQFNAAVSKLSQMPYNQVANLLNELVASSRAMFDPLPKFTGPGGQVVTDPPLKPGHAGESLAPADPPGVEEGNGLDTLDEPTDSERPGWRRLKADEPTPSDAEFDVNSDAWWVRDPESIDKPETGGAE